MLTPNGGENIKEIRKNIETAGPKPLQQWQKGLVSYVCGLLLPTYFWTVWVGFLVLLLLCAQRSARVIVLLGFALGAGVGYGTQPQALALDQEWNTQALVRGVIEEVRAYPGQRLGIVANEVLDVNRNATLPGRLYWSWESPDQIPMVGQEFSTRLRIRPLRTRTNFGLPGSAQHWQRQKLWHRAYSRGPLALELKEHKKTPLRSQLLEGFSELLPQNQGGAVLRALVFGDRFFLTPQFMKQIRQSSLAHSLALSGLHLALVASFGYAGAWIVGFFCPHIFLYLPRQKLGTLLALPLGLGYLWLGGFAPSLQRAALMLGTMAMHQFLGTRRFLQDSLLLAVAILVLLDPGAVHDLSLQLSVLAVLGLVLFLPYLRGFLSVLEHAPWFLRPVYHGAMLAMVSLSANAFILPVLALYFNQVSPHLWLNIFWLPILGLMVMPLAFLGLGMMFVSPTIAQTLLYGAAYPVLGLEQALQVLEHAGWLQPLVVLRPNGLEVLGYWLVLGTGAWILSQQTEQRKTWAFLALGLSLMTVPALVQMGAQARPQMELTVLDTGMSQAVMLRSHTGKTILIDGAGSWNPAYDPGQSIVAPVLCWQYPPRLDYVFLSHMDLDHARGLEYILKTFAVRCFAWTGLVDNSKDSAMIVDLVDQNLWPQLQLRAGDQVVLEPGLCLEVLHPPPGPIGFSSNNNSLVLRVVWHGRGLALIPGDVERQGLAQILKQRPVLDADVLVLPHHGSRSSFSPVFYAQVRPQWAVAACGPMNRFGFPHPQVVQACERAGAEVLSTAEHGAVRFLWTKKTGPVVRLASVAN